LYKTITVTKIQTIYFKVLVPYKILGSCASIENSSSRDAPTSEVCKNTVVVGNSEAHKMPPQA
jgi:hypothetical protein